ncbi:MAG: hypothetical protein SGCHY_005270 [Lobulomycetales sp.]
MYAAGRPHTCSELLGRNITGAITDDIVDLDLLSALLIPDNQIHGALPVEIFELPNLVELDLSGNSITGELITPSSVTNLKEIILSNNSLTGSIPNFAFAHKAELIAIDDNYFVGTLELKFKENDQLRFLNLSGNDFEGKLPQLSPLLEVLDVSFNNKLSGENLWGTSVDFRAEGVPGIVINLGSADQEISINDTSTLIIVASTSAGIVLLTTIISIAIYSIYRRRKKLQNEIIESSVMESSFSSPATIGIDNSGKKGPLAKKMDFLSEIGSGGNVWLADLDGTLMAVKMIPQPTSKLDKIKTATRSGSKKISMVHGNLKSTNVFLIEDGPGKPLGAKVSDAGLFDGVFLKHGRRSGGYLEPGKKDFTKSSDVFACGIIFLEIILQVPPDDIYEKKWSRMKDEGAFQPFQSIVKSMLDEPPETRIIFPKVCEGIKGRSSADFECD